MKPHTVGRTLGIGLRVAGRLATERAAASANAAREVAPAVASTVAEARALQSDAKARLVAGARAGGKSFFAPFLKVAKSLWHEVIGVFFGLFVLLFGNAAWKVHASWMSGPDHQRFLVSVGLCLLFTYLTASSFWFARR
jgi:hypothetical protein